MNLSSSDIQRFWSKVNKTDECWEWTAAINAKGYGVMGVSRKTITAHRVSCMIAGFDMSEAPVVDHACRNTVCVKPEHLRLVTQKQNSENLRGANRNNPSGIRGVGWVDRYQRWNVQVKHHGKNHFGGRFDTIAEAEAAAIALRLELFTHNDLDRV